MSGTSLDGLDIAYCEFNHNTVWSFDLLKSVSIGFPEDIEARLRQSTLLDGLALSQLDVDLALWMGHQVKDFIKKEGFEVDFIASHGHTIFHQPDTRLTLQIGSGTIIHAVTGLPVVYDFRTLDVAWGGQGAPLVPIGDSLLFGQYDYCLNLGGIANISYEEGGARLAYDICACNMVLNYLAGLRSMKYDKNGDMAARGQVVPSLLNELNALSYYQASPPKSLGYEWVRDEIFPLLSEELYSLENMLCTYSDHAAFQIARQVRGAGIQKRRMLITGGGAFNDFFVQRLRHHCGDEVEVVIPEKQIIEFKEALIFAFLGVLRVRGEVNCLSSVTGASKDSCGGVVAGLSSADLVI